MKLCLLLILLIYSHTMMGQLTNGPEHDFETHRIDMIVDMITSNLKKNGWSTILCFGNLPDKFYTKMLHSSLPIAITNIDHEDEDLEDVIPYYSNTILISLVDIEQYEDTMLKIKSSPYWHPLANIILYYHQQNREILPKIYFSLWYYRAINAIIVQYDDAQEVLLISHYSPYMTDDYKLDYLYGCWTTRRIGMPVSGFDEGFTCEQQCHNVSLHSKRRAHYLGTCIGYSITTVPYNASEVLSNLILFPDKSENFHGYKFRAYVTEIEPLFIIDDHGNGSYSMRSRDGMLWNSMRKLMNFSIDLTPSASVIKAPFNFELNIKQIFDFAFRKADFYLIPIYLFDIVVVEIDFTFPYKESGVCIMSHRAGFVTTLFDASTLHANGNIIAQFLACFICIWIVFSIYKGVERRSISLDQIGKDFMNVFRNILLITLYNPPRRHSFRIFLTISIWSFFVINFASQATIISFLTAARRGKEVDTFEDIIEKGYLIHGMASPDLILPEDEERFRIINSRLVSVQSMLECINNITLNDRFCLIDCSVGRYLERNMLNEGEQYLHIAQDRMHSHYLSLLLTKHSPLTVRFNKYLMSFYEAGLIRKWEQYRYNEIKEEPLTRPLGMKDFKSLFDAYCLSVGLIFFIFLLEFLVFNVKRTLRYCSVRKNKRRQD